MDDSHLRITNELEIICIMPTQSSSSLLMGIQLRQGEETDALGLIYLGFPV
jgi:hypothetical protein